MRINKYVAQATSLSRRAADAAIEDGRILINGSKPEPGQAVTSSDTVTLDNVPVKPRATQQTLILNKPVGYVCSRNGQGSKTIYELLPETYQNLNSVGRLDKDSSGLLLLTSDGQLTQQLAHPSYQKQKIYQIVLDKPLSLKDKETIENGVKIDDYVSRLRLSKMENGKQGNDNCSWRVAMSMGRNRQIRRTFETLGYTVTKLHRTQFGDYTLRSLKPGAYQALTNNT